MSWNTNTPWYMKQQPKNIIVCDLNSFDTSTLVYGPYRGTIKRKAMTRKQLSLNIIRTAFKITVKHVSSIVQGSSLFLYCFIVLPITTNYYTKIFFFFYSRNNTQATWILGTWISCNGGGRIAKNLVFFTLIERLWEEK